MLTLMVDAHCWSPFMKSFSKRDCLTGAVIGRQAALVANLLSAEFVGVSKHDNDEIKWLLSGKDIKKRTPMHHAYIENELSIIAMLKEAGFKKEGRRDFEGHHPIQCRHN